MPHHAITMLIHRGRVNWVGNALEYRLCINILDALSAMYCETIHGGVRDGLEAMHVGAVDRLQRVVAALHFVVKCFGFAPGSFMPYMRGREVN